MTKTLFYPDSVKVAEAICAGTDSRKLPNLSKQDFLRVWCSVVYLNPGLHTDNYHDPDYQCAPDIRDVLGEVWRRADAGMLTDEELYPSAVIHARLQHSVAA